MTSKFDKMSRQELRNYMLKHRDDEEAFQVYLDRVMAQPGEIYPAPKTIEDVDNFPKVLDKNKDNQ
ncbi:DUF6887 family protein [Crocosphaera sp.]|uniref:DUF6887 family protein n=1 Tax=Crocosphaera sp. TaxID=2729996 RepID=UPI003F27ECD7